MRDTRKEMSVFLKRQQVRRKRDLGKKLKQLERALISIAIVFAGFMCLYGIYQMIFMGSTFSVERIVVDGKLTNLTARGIAELSGVKDGDNLFWVDIGDVKARLKQEPWIESLAVQRRLPGTLWIYVEEHTPAAIAVGGNDLYYLNDKGGAFKTVEAHEEKDLPVFTGLKISDDGLLPSEDALRAQAMLGLMGLFLASDFGGARDISEIHYDNAEGYSIITKKEPVQILFGHAAFEERIGEISRLAGEITSRPGRIQYMLANEPKKIIVRYQSS